MRARAHARAVAAGGRTRLAELRSEAPLVLRETLGALLLVGGAGGPLGGDELALALAIDAGACLRVRSAAATLAQPGPHPGPSRLDTRITVGAGGRLDLVPEPLVSVVASHHEVCTVAELAPGARLSLVEEVVLGRVGEEPGRVTTTLRVRRDGRPLLAHDLDIGGDAPGWRSHAVLASARAVRTELHVGAAGDTDQPAAVHTTPDGARAARFPLAPGAVLVVALGPDLPAARAAAAPLAFW